MTRLRALWCRWMHPGGHVQHDPRGKINWRCVKCGHWSSHPHDPVTGAAGGKET